MEKEHYLLGGLGLALIVSLIIGQFFSGIVIGVVVGYSIADKGVLASSVWEKVHPHVSTALHGAKLIAGIK
ncbi:MAG: hypothetical protein WAN43_10460 [Rhodomicrobium sp.]|jgi:hypothetical protein